MGIESKPPIRPLYLQVADLLVARISSGVWKSGTIGPTEIELSKELGISVLTARKALEELDREQVQLACPSVGYRKKQD